MTKENRFTVYNYVLFGASGLFTLLSIHFKADISLLAFPVSLIITACVIYFGFIKLIKPKDARKTLVYYKLIQYLPFVMLFSFIIRRAGKNGTSYSYDVICVFLWCVIFIISQIISYFLNPKRLKKQLTGYKTQTEKKKKFSPAKWIFFEAIDWIDALIQAVCMVLLIQIFILQLYVIPSESMVPSYMIGDRVAVAKINCGPKFPLTEVGLPNFTKYDRGDVVVLRNPHYRIDRKSEVKSVISQLVYMLTFMQVNLNTDENGNLKYDPLVKRICGVPGEQLVMQDGMLYARTKDNPEFTPVEKDNKFASWNLNSVKSNLKPYIKDFRMSQEMYDNMLLFEENRRNYDLNTAKFRSEEIIRNVKKYAASDSSTSFEKPELKDSDLLLSAAYIAEDIAYSSEGQKWFENFMTSWIPNIDKQMDLYTEANYKMNVMFKITWGSIIERTSFLLANGKTFNDLNEDSELRSYFSEANTLLTYIDYLLDERNMPVFPANKENGDAQYIPENCYFMMGDNRFNSQDLRHSSEQFDKKLTTEDPLSIVYLSFMEPQYINKKLIQGKPVLRVWPIGRIGSVVNK